MYDSQMIFSVITAFQPINTESIEESLKENGNTDFFNFSSAHRAIAQTEKNAQNFKGKS